MAKDCFTLKIIAPDRVFYEGSAEMVEMNTTEGEIGVYPKHIPMTVIIRSGILNIYEADGEVKKAALHSGFAEILPERITILAEVVEWPEEIDEQRAEAAKTRAEERIRTKPEGIDILRAEAALHRALTRIDLLHLR